MEENELKLNEDDDDSSSDDLKIVLEDDTEFEEQKSKKRKRNENTDSSDDEDTLLPENCKKIDENLSSTAAKNHLTAANVKNILKRVVTNEHVLAIVKLQEEELEDEDEVPEPKITRSKAKEMKKINPDTVWPMDLTPVKLIQVTSPEVTKLIEKDLPDEEGSDEEYHPAPGDGSDDERDTLGSLSDIDSQPRTPCTPGTLGFYVDTTPTKFTDDGLFKVPRDIEPPEEKSEPAIALRTRSRVCLSDKDIEEIEESFIPPDDDVEEYQIDDVWSEFIAEFTNPETPPEPANEDDEANDPEYNASADKVTVDLEELRDDRSVKVSKKELNDLVAELLSIDDIFNIPDSFITAPNSDLVPTALPTNSALQFPAKDSPIKLLDISHSRNLLEHNEFEQKTCIDEIAQNISLTAENIEHNMTQSNLQYDNLTEKPRDEQLPDDQLAVKFQVLDNQSRIVSSTVQMIPRGKPEKQPPPNPISNHLNFLVTAKDGGEFHEAPEFDKEVSVFTPEQRQMLDQQMRMYTQLLTQHFLQLHGHPELWRYGPDQKKLLVELKEKAGDNPHSAFKASNLIAALDLCNSWEARLAEDSEAMREMMQFIINELKKGFIRIRNRSMQSTGMKFCREFMETVLDSNVFIYPQLLPTIPFRVQSPRSGGHDYLPSEDHLIAMGMEQYNEFIDANPKIFGKRRLKGRSKCFGELIATYTTRSRTARGITSRMFKVGVEKYPDNPIQHYFIHKKYPRITFPIITFNPNWTPRDHPLSSLPETWRYYLDPSLKPKKAAIVRLDALSVALQQQWKTSPKNPIEISHRSPGEISPYPSSPSSPTAASTFPHENLTNYPVTSQNCEQISGSNGLTSSNPFLRFQLKDLGGGQFAVNPVLLFDRHLNGNLPHANPQIKNVPSQGSKEKIQSKEVNIPSKISTRSSSKVITRSKSNSAPSKDKVLPVKYTNTKKTPPPKKRGKSVKKSVKKSPQKSVKKSPRKSVKKSPEKGSQKKTVLPNDLEEEISQVIALDSDTNFICKCNECPIVSRPLRTSTPSVAKTIVNECRNTQTVPSQAHTCPCEYSICSFKEVTLPENQTLLTQFFKRSNGVSKGPVGTVVKLEQLDANSQPLKKNSVCENNKPNGEVNYISSHNTAVRTNGCVENFSIRAKHTQEELLVNCVPLRECNGRVDSQSSDDLSSDDQLSPNNIQVEEALDSDNSNEYNSENHTLSTILSKLQCLLIINAKRKELLRDRNKQLFKLKSDLAWKIRAKLFKEIQHVESMLPSMPNLTAASKSGLEGPDESSLLSGIPTPGPDEHTQFIVPEIQTDIKKPEEKSARVRLRKSPRPRAGLQSTKHRMAARAQREMEANRAMFATSDPNTNDLKETACATAYFEKVQSRLTSNTDPCIFNRFSDFQDILENYDPEKETPCNLYHKLNTFFGQEHEDLTEEFLTFLTAGQAVEVGRFMDHFMLTNMSDFIERLQIYFSRRPAQLRKILWCLERITENIDTSSDSVTIESIKATILPQLKGNKHLVNWFLRLLPNEKPPDSQMHSGFEVLDVEGLSKNIDSGNSPEHLDYEVLNIPPIEDTYGTDQCACTCHNSSDEKYKSRTRHCIPCGTKYMQGRLYIQNGRGLRAARVEWGGGSGGKRAACQSRHLTPPPAAPRAGAGVLRWTHRSPGTVMMRKRLQRERKELNQQLFQLNHSPKFGVMRVVRTPTSKTKFTRLSKNSTKSGDTEETPNKPSCSKSIIKDENLTENPLKIQNIDNLENLANVLPGNEPHEEQEMPDNDLEHCDDHVEEPSSQQLAEYTITDSPSLSTAPSTSTSDNTIIKNESIEIPLDEDDINMDSETANEEVEPVFVKTETEPCWTREEDKAILLVLQNESDSDYTFEKIQKILPHRSIGEIRDRFQSVMLLLQQMASNNT